MAGTLPLRLTRTEPVADVIGLVLERRAALPLLQRLDVRLPHYASLRLAATRQDIVLLSPERKALPWSEAVRHYLRQQGPAILPVDSSLDVPERWHEQIVTRLAAHHGAALPMLLLPVGPDGAFRVVDLAGARPLADIDLPRLAGESLA